jgi:hypothetical protein
VPQAQCSGRPCFGDLTFDMSGGGQTAKLAGRRPLDGGVRFRGFNKQVQHLRVRGGEVEILPASSFRQEGGLQTWCISNSPRENDT